MTHDIYSTYQEIDRCRKNYNVMPSKLETAVSCYCDFLWIKNGNHVKISIRSLHSSNFKPIQLHITKTTFFEVMVTSNYHLLYYGTIPGF